ncbi:S-layer homology domain-containing protein [Paenibacillus sp. P32E]|uniref:S-layer homology domain-containing protein n=1 Tax=Paenibacillus sp. P32E TaxID=1349434 RepID=UPI00093E36B6|nr:S-layer homology domain-containing protein [Paenibacillus sp. P32E]OKP93399.1 hypothetical protein A3848_05350 [Paenibacillus sp. P32E]
MDRVYQKGLSIFLVLLMVWGGISGVIVPSGGTAHAAGSFAGGDGSASDPYQIATADQLNEVRNHLDPGLYFKLIADIDLSSYANWMPIGVEIYTANSSGGFTFRGNMDGNGYKITNLKIDQPVIVTDVGLFGRSSGNITNMILEDIEVKGTNPLASGGLLSVNYGTISNTYVTGRIVNGINSGGLVNENYGTISNSYALVSVAGAGTIGGLVGNNNSSGSISNSYATGSVTGAGITGGLVGRNDGTIINSYATGNVSGTRNYLMGGLVGYSSNLSGSNFYDINTTGQTDTGKGTGKTTAEMQDPATFSDWDFSRDWYMLSGQYPQLWAFIALTPGANAGTTKLTGVASGMEYKVNTGSYTPIVDTSVDNIVVGVGDKIYVRVKGSAQPASAEQTRSVSAQDIKIVTIQSAAIDRVTVPVTGATPVAAIADTPEYTAAIAWNPSDVTFAGAVSYTATVTITPKAGYTLKGVPANFFTVAGATTTNAADSGVVTAVFPATAAAPITTAAIDGVIAPVAGEAPVAALAPALEYTAAIAWSPAAAKFAGAASYTATISLTPKQGYTLTGVAKDFFKVAGATTTNAADSGVVTAVFPATAAVPISTAAIAGVTVPVAGEAPVAVLADTTEYTAAIDWTPADAKFAGAEIYTAKISLTPKLGYTLAGVTKDFFKVAGATTTNAADSGIVTAVFPATAAVPISTATIAGVTVPVAGGAPVTALAPAPEYTAAIAWSPADVKFAGATMYIAKITLTPKPGYTLAGVAKDFFKVAGATTTNAADSGVVTAVFPATAAVPITTSAIDGVIAPVAGAAPKTSIADTTEYTAAIAWTPADVKFAGEVSYTAKVTLTPKPGYTLAGVAKDFFKVAGATTTNAADSGVVTAVFPATSAVPITTAAIDGVIPPVAGAAPKTSIADTAEYTAAIAWTPADVKFAAAASYTATISLMPKPGYTLAGVAKDFFKVAGATTTNAADSGVVTAVFPATAAASISTAVIAGVVLPVAGGTPVATLPETAEYTASVAWTPADATFAGGIAYNATITLTPKPGYTLAGVPEYFFSVPGAITTNTADSGVVIAQFPATAIIPATAVPITAAGIEGVTLPVTGATPVTTATYSPEYTATVSWSPATTVFAPGTAYTATITVTPKLGFSLTGVPANFFTVAGANTTNTADSGVVTAEFPATATVPDTEPPVTAIPITAARVAGVTVPVIGAVPVTTATYSPEYTATVSWSPATTVFVPSTAYTATITITPKPGYTLRGVPAYFFTVPGASTTNTANSGVVTAEFPATAPVITDMGTGTGTAFTPSTNNIITSTNGKITLPVNQAGEVSFEDGVKISIPAGAAAKELTVSIEKVLEPQKLFPNKEILLSPVYEITKNFAEDFSKPVTLNIAFDPALVTSNQQAAVFYYDEVKKAWIEVVGGKIEGNHIIVEVNRVGKYTVLSVDKVTGLPVRAPVTESPTEITLRDVAGHWAAASIQQALSMGMVKGYLDGTFRPNHSVTRAEFAVMLMNVLKPQGAGARLTFTDTATIGPWAQSAIAQAVQAGIITGYEDGGFRPNAEITRAEMAVILAKALGVTTELKTVTGFADDKDIPAWAKSSVDFVKEAEIVQGKGENAFAPQDSATRAEAVTVLLKLLAQQKK